MLVRGHFEAFSSRIDPFGLPHVPRVLAGPGHCLRRPLATAAAGIFCVDPPPPAFAAHGSNSCRLFLRYDIFVFCRNLVMYRRERRKRSPSRIYFVFSHVPFYTKRKFILLFSDYSRRVLDSELNGASSTRRCFSSYSWFSQFSQDGTLLSSAFRGVHSRTAAAIAVADVHTGWQER